MSSQHRVQQYLEKHRISALFEDLMAKIINNMPDDPLAYLSATLDRKMERRKTGSSALRHSTGDLSRTQPSGAGASTWASMDMTVAKEKTNYDKPWLSNSKRQTRKVDTAARSLSPERKGTKGKREWNPDNRVKAGTFDELFEEKHAEPKQLKDGGKTYKKNIHSLKEDDSGLTFVSSGFTGPVRKIESDDEFAVPKYKEDKKDKQKKKDKKKDKDDGDKKDKKDKKKKDKKQDDEESEDEDKDKKDKKNSKRKSAKSDAQSHRQELEDYIKKNKKKDKDSGIEEDHQFTEYDDAIEVSEDDDDLENEGMIIKKKHKKNKKHAKTYHPPAEPLIKVSICGRCARVLTGDDDIGLHQSSGSTPDAPESQSPVMSRPQSAIRFNSDDEFESVSQVTGPRRPIWMGEDTDDAGTPRTGPAMYESSGRPNKGQPMYGRKSQESFSSLPPQSPALPSARTDVISETSTRQVWAHKRGKDDSLEDRNVDTPDALNTGHSWAVPDDSEMSDVDWEKERARKTKFRMHKTKTTGGQY